MEVQAIGHAWFRRKDWADLLLMMPDMSSSYEEWLVLAEKSLKHLESTGKRVLKVEIRPLPFGKFCSEQNITPSREARITYVNKGVFDIISKERR